MSYKMLNNCADVLNNNHLLNRLDIASSKDYKYKLEEALKKEECDSEDSFKTSEELEQDTVVWLIETVLNKE